MAMNVEVKIKFEDKEAEVEFKGIWTRSLVDRAYRFMLRQLPSHIAFLKQRIVIPEIILEEREVK
jgi:hypothetical protein